MMSTSTITFFPVDNGSMALLKLNDENNTTLLIDMRVRETTDNGNDDVFDVSSYLRNQLNEDINVRPYIDAFILTHNDDDHIKGIQEHFHLGDPEDYKEPNDEEESKIIMKEAWCSHRFWKRSSNSNKLCDDAKAFNKEMKRRVTLFEDSKEIQVEGNRALIIVKDPEGKTDGLDDIVKDIDTNFSVINNKELSKKIIVRVLGPLPQQENEEDEDYNKKNRGSVILHITVIEEDYYNEILLTGDAEVFVWDCLWNKYKSEASKLQFDILLAPHHCSWHSLSYDSQSSDENPKVSNDAKSALSQAKDGAYIISSSKPINEDDCDPPSIAAKKEYLTIVTEKHFLCTEEYPSETKVEPIVIKLTNNGPQLKAKKSTSKLTTAAIASTGEAFPHG